MNNKRYAIGLAVALVLVATPLWAGFQETKSFSSGNFTLNNLIGKVEVRGHSGSDFQVKVDVQGRDGTRDNIKIKSDGDSLSVVFPVNESRDYVYPELGSGSRTSFNPSHREGSWLSKVLSGISGRDKIEVRGSGKGLEVWADVEVLVPRGGEVQVYLGVGRIEADDVDGDVLLDTASGGIQGKNLSGEIVMDTGSGHVQAESLSGKVVIDTGSGHVSLSRCDCEDLSVDTGSGHVELDDIRGRTLSIDTGSGHVEARRVEADSASIDTGSGSVTLELTRMGSGDFDIDTGSGGITLALPPNASADVEAETGSGGIHFELDQEIRIRRKERDEVSFSVGGGGAHVRLDTGSGGIRIKEMR